MPSLRLLAAVALALPALGSASSFAAPPAAAVTSGTVVLRTTDDTGTCASDPRARVHEGVTCPTFPLYYAAAPRPKALVVVFHGHGHNGSQYPAQLLDLATRFGVVAVAPDTQQLAAGLPSYRGPFDSVDEEARDAAAAIAWARSTYRTHDRTYLLGVSMGGSGLAYFLDAATRPSAGDADATWVQALRPLPLAGLVDAEGIGNLAETWLEAKGFDATSAAEIEKETGGTPGSAPGAYRSRSLALLPALGSVGLRAAAVVHDVDDGLVPYDQTFETRAAFAAAGVPVHTYDVVFKGSCAQGDQTTITERAPVDVDSHACLAGHANENAAGTPVMRAAVLALGDLLAGGTYGARVVNATPPSS